MEQEYPGEYEESCTLLENSGWQEFNDATRPDARFFYRRFATPTRCRLNADKHGMQVQVGVWRQGEHWSHEIEICGELPDGTWVKIKNYPMPRNLHDGIAQIPRLLATWEFMAGATINPPTSRT